MVARIKVKYDDHNATENLEELGDQAGYTGQDFDKMSEKVEDAEQSTKNMGKTADQASVLLSKMGSAVAVAFSVDTIVEFTNRTNRFADALGGAQINTGKTARETDLLAREMQVASSNALGYADALELLSRGTQSSAITTEQMTAAIKFASVNAKATGQDVRQAIEQITESLVNGSAEMLKKIGLLPGGIDQVRHAYDQLRGEVGLFDQLSEDARKLEIQMVALDAIRNRTEDLEEFGLEGMNTMDELAGSWERFQDAVGRLFESVGAGEWFGNLARTLDRVTAAVEKTAGAVDFLWQRWELMQESFIRWGADAVSVLEAIGLAEEGTASGMRELAQSFHDAREGERLLAEQQEASRDQAAANIKARRDEQAAARKAAAEAWAKEKQAAEDARVAAQDAANAERDREKQMRGFIRLRMQKQRELEREEREAERDRERALQERMRIEQQQYRKRLKQLEEEIKKEKELQQLQQQKIDDIKSLIRAQGSDGASASGELGGGSAGPPNRPQGMQFAGPLGGFFAGLVGEQQARFNFAASRLPGGAQGGGGPGGGGGAGGGGLPSRMSGGNATQQVIDNVFAGVDQNKIEDEVIRIRVEAARAERDAVIAKARAGEGGTISQRRDTVRQAEAQFAEQRRQAFRSGRRGAFDEKERDRAVQNIVQNEIERAGKSAELDQNTVKAMAELAKEQAAQIAQMDRIEKAQQAIMQTIMTNRRTRAQRAGRGR